MGNRSHEALESDLEKAEEQIKVGGTYYNFKNPEKLYKVIALGIQESSDTVCVVYQAEYNKKLIFVRDLESWLKQPEENVQRFKLVK